MALRCFDGDDVAALRHAAITSPRRRAHATLHDDLADPIQRVVIGLETATYVRPHRHGPLVWELFTLLDGALAVLTFDDDGRVTGRVELRPGGPRLVQVPPGCWHGVVALAPATLALEVKPGPYRPTAEGDFAAWAPPEGAATVPAMLNWLVGATIGACRP